MVQSYLTRDMTEATTFSLFIRPSTARPWHVALGVERFRRTHGPALTVSQDHPGLDIVYELVEYDGRPVAKFSGSTRGSHSTNWPPTTELANPAVAGSAAHRSRSSKLVPEQRRRSSAPPGPGTMPTPKGRLLRSSRRVNQSVSARDARSSRSRRACIGNIRSATSSPVSRATVARYSRRRSLRYRSWPAMPS